MLMSSSTPNSFCIWLEEYYTRNALKGGATFELVGNKSAVLKMIQPCFNCLVRATCLRVSDGSKSAPVVPALFTFNVKQEFRFSAKIKAGCDLLKECLCDHTHFVSTYWSMGNLVHLVIRERK